MLRKSGENAARTSLTRRRLTGRIALLTARKRVREFESTQYRDHPMTLRFRTSRIAIPKNREPSAIVQETRTSLSLTPIAAAAGTGPTTPVRRTTSGKDNRNERSRLHRLQHLRNHQRLARRNRNGERSGAKSAEKASSKKTP
jgi:hypothetical protein